MDLFDAEILAKELISRAGLDYEFGWIRARNTYGRCSYKNRTIYLSSTLTPLCSPEDVTNTIIHEICHALTPRAKHGKAWQDKMREFGREPSTLVNYNVDRTSLANWLAVCKACGQKSYSLGKPRRLRSCGTHGNHYDEKYLLRYERIR